MDINETKIKFEEQQEMKFSRKFKILLRIAIFMTGSMGIIGVSAMLTAGKSFWLENGMNWFVETLLFYVTNLIIFIALVKIAKSKRPFSSVITYCMMTIGIMYIIASIVAPRIPGFRQTGYEILMLTPKVWLEGFSLQIGLLFIILGKILQYGFYYQKESDETL